MLGVFAACLYSVFLRHLLLTFTIKKELFAISLFVSNGSFAAICALRVGSRCHYATGAGPPLLPLKRKKTRESGKIYLLDRLPYVRTYYIGHNSKNGITFPEARRLGPIVDHMDIFIQETQNLASKLLIAQVCLIYRLCPCCPSVFRHLLPRKEQKRNFTVRTRC